MASQANQAASSADGRIKTALDLQTHTTGTVRMPAHRTTGHVNALIDAGIAMFGLVMGRRLGGLDGLGGRAPVWGARGVIETSVGLAPRLAGILSSGVV